MLKDSINVSRCCPRSAAPSLASISVRSPAQSRTRCSMCASRAGPFLYLARSVLLRLHHTICFLNSLPLCNCHCLLCCLSVCLTLSVCLFPSHLPHLSGFKPSHPLLVLPLNIGITFGLPVWGTGLVAHSVFGHNARDADPAPPFLPMIRLSSHDWSTALFMVSIPNFSPKKTDFFFKS